jgi:hypothetical protein
MSLFFVLRVGRGDWAHFVHDYSQSPVDTLPLG